MYVLTNKVCLRNQTIKYEKALKCRIKHKVEKRILYKNIVKVSQKILKNIYVYVCYEKKVNLKTKKKSF